MKNIIENLRYKLINEAAMGSAYASWSDDFARNNIKKIWENPKQQFISINFLQSLSKDELYALGFGNWNNNLILIPLYLINFIPDGEVLTCIDGKQVVKEAGSLDLDIRFGCVAYGFLYHTEPYTALQLEGWKWRPL